MLFGGYLHDACLENDVIHEIPPFLEEMISYLEQHGLESEGLFRISAQATAITRHREALEQGGSLKYDQIKDPNEVACLLKLYLRELAEPVIPFELYDSFLNCCASGLSNAQLIFLLQQLPKPNYNVLKRLLLFLKKLGTHSDRNKMNSANLATVIGPNLFRPVTSSRPGNTSPRGEAGMMIALMTDSANICRLVEHMIDHAEVLFQTQQQDDSKIQCQEFHVSIIENLPPPPECLQAQNWGVVETPGRVLVLIDEAKEADLEKCVIEIFRETDGICVCVGKPVFLCETTDSSRYFALPAVDAPTYIGFAFYTRQESTDFKQAIGPYKNAAYPVNAPLPPPLEVLEKALDLSGIFEPTCFEMTQKYFNENRLEEDDIIYDGFCDGGSKLPTAEDIKAAPNLTEREFIYIDKQQDPKLARILKISQNLVEKFPTLELKIRIIAMHVANHMGGSVDSDSFMDATTIQMATSTGSGASSAPGSPPMVGAYGTVCEEPVPFVLLNGNPAPISSVSLPARSPSFISEHTRKVKLKYNSNFVPLGSINRGASRHRALLFKYICDHLEPRILCKLLRESNTSEDAINFIRIKINDYKKVDLMKDPGRLRNAFDSTDMGKREKRLSVSQKPPKDFRWIMLPDLQNEELVMHERLGKGGFANVYRCALGPIACAVKVYTKTEDRVTKQLLRECRFQANLKHKNILRCIGYQNSDKYFYTFFEYCARRSVWELMYKHRADKRPFTVKEIVHYGSAVASGLAYLHLHNVSHRDVKSSNVLLDGESEPFSIIKLCDFNTSTNKHLSGTIMVGTLQYMAPELLKPETQLNLYDPSFVDIWSFGMFLVELLTLGAPYEGLKEAEQLSLILQGKLPPNVPVQHPILPLIQSCTKMEPTERLTADEVVNMFKDLLEK